MKQRKSKDTTLITNRANDYKCPLCSNTSYQLISKAEPTKYPGVLADGSRFTETHREFVQCDQCANRHVAMFYIFNSADWK